MDDKTVNVLLRFVLDGQAVQRVRSGSSKIADELARVEKQANATREKMEKLSQVGIRLSLAGAAITGPLILGAAAYSKAIGQVESGSARWINATKRVEYAGIRFGRTVAEQLDPALERGAELAERMVAILERNPALVKGALGVGVGLTAAGGILAGIGEIGKLTATVQSLMATKAGAAILPKLGTVALNASAVIIGAEVGLLLGNAIGKAIYGAGFGDRGMGDVGRTALTAAAIPGKSLVLLLRDLGVITPEAARKMNQMNNAIVDIGKSAEASAAQVSSSTNRGLFAEQNVQDWIDFQKQITDAAKAYEKQRAQIEEDFGLNVTRLTKQTSDQRGRILRDSATEERQAAEDYYKERRQMARDFGVETERAEADHQEEMRRMREDGAQRIEDLVAARDALGLARELKAQEVERRRAEKDYITEQRRRRADYAQQLADMESAFVQQRARRAAQTAQALADLQKSYDDQLQQLKDNKARELQALRSAYNDQLTALRQAFIDRIRQIDATVLSDYKAWQAKLKKASQDFQNWLNSNTSGSSSGSSGGSGSGSGSSNGPAGGGATPMNTGGNQQNLPSDVIFHATQGLPGHAKGGYAGFGVYKLGEGGIDEFVMSGRTTRQAERLLGRRLTQEALIGGLAGAGRRMGPVSMQFTFNGAIDPVERERMREEFHDQIVAAFLEVENS